jgi:uncharacterized protein (DUF433 family)
VAAVSESRLCRVDGKLCLAGTTVPIVDIAAMHRDGAEPWEMLRRWPMLTLDHLEYAMRYSQRRAERRSPDGKAKRQRGRIQKQRGYRAEKQLEARLAGYGFQRVPMSGALGGKLTGDLRRDVEDHRSAIRIVEVKRRAGGQAVWRGWLAQGKAHLLVVVPGGGQEPLAVLELATVEALFREAGYTGMPQERTQTSHKACGRAK